ncbi:MAG: hypothetical protein HYV02_02065 [Deltaproteobacteria bacterium]|nr:hypothetical protein [Deltaproteobacteria bacterium]
MRKRRVRAGGLFWLVLVGLVGCKGPSLTLEEAGLTGPTQVSVGQKAEYQFIVKPSGESFCAYSTLLYVYEDHPPCPPAPLSNATGGDFSTNFTHQVALSAKPAGSTAVVASQFVEAYDESTNAGTLQITFAFTPDVPGTYTFTITAGGTLDDDGQTIQATLTKQLTVVATAAAPSSYSISTFNEYKCAH